MFTFFLWDLYNRILTMTFYTKQIARFNKDLYSKDYLTQQVMAAKRFINHHFAEDITLGDISGSSFFSKFHFLRLFKKYYGQTPHQYLTAVRINKAKEFLQKGAVVSETSYSVGFNNLSSFSRLFKNSTGYSPAEYRRKKAIFAK